MSYVITIKKSETKTVAKRGEYTTVGRVPWTEAELNKELSSHYGSTADFLKANPLRAVFDYAPTWQGVETSETEVLKQTVESLDLASVIKAINGL